MIGISLSSLGQWRREKEQLRDPTSAPIHGLFGKPSNYAKHPVMVEIFKGLVVNLRTPTGKAKGRKRFWLDSSIKCIAALMPESSPRFAASDKASLWKRYQNVIKAICIQGECLRY